ncbi:hypothetical protein [Spiroplasma phoeniceum]|uniref:hypothetical protein n=1 Tax=Spiroplasma phoeniceum TaxID=47835 RepID=UPI003364D873
MGITWENVVNNEQINTSLYHNFQNYLSSLMNTNVVSSIDEEILGTKPFNLLEVINTFINRYVPIYHSSIRNFYSVISLGRGYTNHKLFYDYIRNSLNNNLPAIIAFSGVLPG